MFTRILPPPAHARSTHVCTPPDRWTCGIGSRWECHCGARYELVGEWHRHWWQRLDTDADHTPT